MNDAESRWWRWHVSERRGGLTHQYRDERFEDMHSDPTLRRTELGNQERAAARPECPCPGDSL